MHLLQHKSEA